MIFNRTYGGKASGHILRMAIGIMVLALMLASLVNAQDTSSPNYITQWWSLGNGDGQFNTPIGIAID